MKTHPLAIGLFALLASPVPVAQGQGYADNPFKPLSEGVAAVKEGKDALREGDIAAACAAFRRAESFLGAPELTRSASHYPKLEEKKIYPEAFCLLKEMDIGTLMGSLRLPKAACRIILDRFPDLHVQQGGKLVPLSDFVQKTYAGLCRASEGDDAACAAITKALAEQRWQDALDASARLMEDSAQDKNSPAYTWARCAALTAHYKLGHYQEAMDEGLALLEDPAKPLDSLDMPLARRDAYKRQLHCFLMHSCYALGRLTECLELGERYQAEAADASARDAFAPFVRYLRLAALYKLKDYGRVAREGESLVSDASQPLDSLGSPAGGRGIYKRQACYFVLHAYYELKQYPRCVELCDKYLADFAGDVAQDPFAPLVHAIRDGSAK